MHDIASAAYHEIPAPVNLLYWIITALWSRFGKMQVQPLHDIGDGILNLEFHTKMKCDRQRNTGRYPTFVDIAEKIIADWWLVTAANFSAGAPIPQWCSCSLLNREYDELDFAIRISNTVSRVRFSGIPVAVAPHGRSAVVAKWPCSDDVLPQQKPISVLVEVGAGLIPGRWWNYERLRASDKFLKAILKFQRSRKWGLPYCYGKVATSARGTEMGILRRDTTRKCSI